MKKIKGFLITALLLFLFEGIYGQSSLVTYYMKIPQNHFLNPAIKPSDRTYIGIPVLTGFNAGMGNNFIGLNDLFINGSFMFNSPTFSTEDLSALAGKLKKQNTITADANIQLLGLGLSFGKDLYLFLDINDRLNAKALFPRSVLDLFLTGYDSLLGKTIDFSGINMKAQYFREYGLGFSKNVTSNLRIGGKVKLLSGIASRSLDNRVFQVEIDSVPKATATQNASWDVAGKEVLHTVFSQNKIIGKTSDPTAKKDILGFIGDYATIPVSNMGIGFDIGVVYTLGKLLTFSASVTDLGFINWKNDIENYKSDGSFDLPGLTLQDVADGDISAGDLMKTWVDESKSQFILDSVARPFKTYLPTSVTVGASFNPLKAISLGVISNTRFYAGQVKESVTLSGNAYIGRVVSASMSYTIANYSYNNLGFGLAFKTGAVAQFYIIADKIPLSWEKVSFNDSGGTDQKTIPMPANFNMLNLQIGFNIVFGKPVTVKADKPMLLEPK